MLTITRIAAKQSEETKQERNFNKSDAPGEIFEWWGQGAVTLGLSTSIAKATIRRKAFTD